jgi:hypothetical protein
MLCEQYYDKAPEELMALDLGTLSPAEIKEMAYFIWAVYQDEPELLEFRTSKLLPILQCGEPECPEEEEAL